MIATIPISEQVQSYIDGVMSGEIVVGRNVRLAVERHVGDLENAGERGFYFDEDLATEACEFFPAGCCHSKGKWAGQPFHLAPWQMFIVWCVFGWRQKSDEFRRFRKLFASVARKNGKSTLCAALGLLMLVFDNPKENAAEVYCAATKEDQACIVFAEAKRMRRQSPSMSRLTKAFTKSITHEDGFFQPIGSDSETTDGLNPNCVIKDELHAWREHHRGLHEKLSTGGASRDQPLEIIITTAGDDKSEIWAEENDYAIRIVESVLTGTIVDDTVFSFVACLDKDDDPFDKKNWPKANPNIGVSVRPDYLPKQANEAQQKPTARNSFLRYHCNIRVASTEKAVMPEVWAACEGELNNMETLTTYGAFDIGRSDDFAAVGLVTPFTDFDGEGEPVKKYEIGGRTFTCSDRDDDLLTYQMAEWVEQDLIEVHPGGAVEIGMVGEYIKECHDRYDVFNWCYDATFAKQLAQELEAEGLSLFEYYQTPKKYNEPIREFIKALKQGRIVHNGDSVLGWQFGNLTIKRNAKDQWLPDKGASAKFKIDIAVAILMAFSEALFHDDDTLTFYENNELEMA